MILTLKDILAKRNGKPQEKPVVIEQDEQADDMELVYAMIPSLRTQTDEFSEIF